ncbi:MAG TPA: hypothetical protein VF993_09540 [Myxococcales bacterium]
MARNSRKKSARQVGYAGIGREGRSIHLGWAPRKRSPEPRDRMRRPKVREPETVNVEGAAAE